MAMNLLILLQLSYITFHEYLKENFRVQSGIHFNEEAPFSERAVFFFSPGGVRRRACKRVPPGDDERALSAESLRERPQLRASERKGGRRRRRRSSTAGGGRRVGARRRRLRARSFAGELPGWWWVVYVAARGEQLSQIDQFRGRKRRGRFSGGGASSSSDSY